MGFIPEKWFTRANPSPQPTRPVPFLVDLPVVQTQDTAPPPPAKKKAPPSAEEEVIALTWADAAAALGIKIGSMKARVRRGNWHRTMGKDGKVLIHVPTKALVNMPRTLLVGKMSLIDKLGIPYIPANQLINSKDFPKPIKVSKHRVAWKISEVDEWIENKNKETTKADGSKVFKCSGNKTVIYTPAKEKNIDVLSKYIIEKRNLIGGLALARSVPPLVCRDGFEMSVQASAIHYSSPRVNEGPWTEFECGFPNKPVPELRQWREALQDDAPDEDCVFAYVPWVAVMLTIEKHGGCVVLEEMK
jgi:hypothetical protein